MKKSESIPPVNTKLMNQTMYNTLNSTTTLTVQNSKFKNILKAKLSYEWKNIYRQLCTFDKSS